MWSGARAAEWLVVGWVALMVWWWGQPAGSLAAEPERWVSVSVLCGRIGGSESEAGLVVWADLSWRDSWGLQFLLEYRVA